MSGLLRSSITPHEFLICLKRDDLTVVSGDEKPLPVPMSGHLEKFQDSAMEQA